MKMLAKHFDADVEAPTEGVSPGWDFFPPKWKSYDPNGKIQQFRYWK